jgi:hypothetical protein
MILKLESDTQAALEKRHVIRFLVKNGIQPKEIPDRLRNIYHEAAMKKTQVCFWVRTVRRSRADFSDEDHLPPVSMKFSFITLSGTYIQQFQQISGFLGDLATNGYCPFARRA